MAATATARRTRKAATPDPADLHNVQLASGRGVVHAHHQSTNGAPYPACRTVDPSATAGRVTARTGRYAHALAPVNCPKCLEQTTNATRASATRKAAPTTSPRAARARRNGVAQQEADQQAKQVIAKITDEVLAKRGTHADLEAKRNPKCSDDDYALALRVRELRAAGEAWWRIAQTLDLPGAGASAKEGKTGAAHARRAWEKAWGKTYSDTTVPRETKAIKTERALTEPGRPYFAADTTDAEILDRVRGKEIEWATRLGAGDGVVCSIQKAIVSGFHKADVVQGPKGRVLKFYELPEQGSRVSGPLRSVYVDRIEKVGL